MSTETPAQTLVAKPKGSVMLLRRNLTLDDLLADSLIQTIMQADRVEPETVRALMDGAARRLAAGRASQHNGVAFARTDGYGRTALRAANPPRAARPLRARNGDGAALCC
jgi:hypothetical protein